MIRFGSVWLVVAALLANSAAVHGEDVKMPRTDLYGDPLPPGAVARLGTIRMRHSAEAAFSKDGKQLISCAIDGEVRFWDVATGKLLRRHSLLWKPQEDECFNGVTLSPDGTVAAAYSYSGQTVYLFNTHTGKEWGRIRSIKILNPERLMAFSPDGKYLAVQTETKKNHSLVQIWDISAVKLRQILTNDLTVQLSRVAFSPDATRLAGIAEAKRASGKREGDVDLFLWDTATGALLRARKQLHRIDLHSLAFSPDGKTLALGSRFEAVVHLLAADTLEERTQLTLPVMGVEEYVNDLVFSPDGTRLAASWGSVRHHPASASFTFDVMHDVLLWDLAKATAPRRLPEYNGGPWLFAPDGKILACRMGSAIRLYDPASGRLLHSRPGHTGADLTLAVSADGKTIASGDRDGILRLWDAATSKQLWESASRDLRITDCFFSADGKGVAAGNTGGPFFDFQTWETATGKKLGRILLHADYGCLHAAALSADGKRFRGVYTKEVNEPPCDRIDWDVASGKRLSQRPYRLRRKEYPQGVAISAPATFAADGERLTVWLGDRMGIEEVSTGSLLAKLPKEMEWPSAFSPDGRLLLAITQYAKDENSDGDEIEERSLIETASGQEILRLKWLAPNKTAFALDGSVLMVSDHKGLRVWDTETGEKLYQMAWPESIAKTTDFFGYPYVPSLASLPGSRVAASMPEGDIVVWDLQPSHWPQRKEKQQLERKELESLWSALAGEARQAYRAIHKLTAAPISALALLQTHLRPERDEKHIEQLVADLDSDSFSAREKAAHALRHMPYRAEPMLRRALHHKPSLEMRRRIESVLTEPRLPQAEDLRKLRAILVLERIGTPEARQLLEKLAGGATSPETRAAQTALQRLKQRVTAAKP